MGPAKRTIFQAQKRRGGTATIRFPGILPYLLKNTTGLYVCKRLTSPGLGVLRGKLLVRKKEHQTGQRLVVESTSTARKNWVSLKNGGSLPTKGWFSCGFPEPQAGYPYHGHGINVVQLNPGVDQGPTSGSEAGDSSSSRPRSTSLSGAAAHCGEYSFTAHRGMGQNETTRGRQVFANVSIYRGWVPIFDPHPHGLQFV